MIADPQPELTAARNAVADRWPCWVEVDLDAIAHNVTVLTESARPKHGLTAVVKAQAYGLGATAVSEAALAAGARGLAVARVAEGAQLRANGITAPILVMGGTAPSETAQVVRLGLTPTVTDQPTLELLKRHARESGAALDVQVKIDTGMNRYGARPQEGAALVREIAASESLRLQGIYTHFAAADESDLWFAKQQIAYYLATCRQLEGEGYDLGLKHAANSAASLRMDNIGLDTIRTGIGLSGSYATTIVPRTGGLRSAVSLKARVARLNAPPVGASIGYGRTYRVERPMNTALVPCGYADGLPRSCGNRAQVLIHGQRAPLVGSVSMDMCVVDVSHIENVQLGDEVVVIGRQGEDEVSVDELSEYAGIIPHELLVRLGARAPRLYLRGDRMIRAVSLSTDGEIEMPMALGH